MAFSRQGAGLLLAFLLAASATAQIPSDSLVLEGDYIRTGVSNNGTLGVGGNTSPGFIFDSTGTGTFDTANDYLTPGSPHEGFSVQHDSSGVYVNNNTGITNIGPASAPTATAEFDNSASWSGSISGEFDITHEYGFDDASKNVQIKTTISATTDLTNVRFSRWIDPDSGGTSSINTRGNATLALAPEDWVNSESETNGATLGLYSSDSVTHNTGIDPGWSTDPDFYIAGTGDTTGDHTIGLGFDIGDLLNGESITFIYLYAVGADVDDFVGIGGGYASQAATFNQISTATFVDGLGGGAPADLTTALDTALASSEAEFQMALDQFSGAVYGSIVTANLQHTSYYLSQLASRFRGQMNPGDPLSSSGYVVAEPNPAEVMLASFEQACCEQPGPGTCSSRSTRCCSRSQVHRAWISGYGLGGIAFSDGNADSFDYGLGGTQFAVERAISRNWEAGIWGNMAWGQVDARNLNEQAELENYHFGGHLVGFDGCDYWIGLAGAGYDKASIRRYITAGSLNLPAAGTVDGMQTNLYLERGRSLCHRGWHVQPYAALQYVYLYQDDLLETGAGALNLAVGDINAHSLRSVLGTRLAKTFRTRCGTCITHNLSAAWIHEYFDAAQVISSSFTGTNGSFPILGVDLGRDWAQLGTGVSLHLNRNARLYANYDVQVNEHQTLHVGSGGVEVAW